MEGSVHTPARASGALIWRGVCPWGKSAIARRRRTSSRSNRRRSLVRHLTVRRFAAFLGPIRPVRTRVVSDPQD